MTSPHALAFTLVAVASFTSQALAQPLVGSWSFKDGRTDLVVSFLANGSYVLAEDGKPEPGSSGKDGMERGTYRWNSKSGGFSTKTTVDTNGDWGFNPDPLDSAVVTGNKLRLSESGGGITLQRVVDSKSTLTGGWMLQEGNTRVVVTFLANGTYFFAQDAPSGGGGKSGMERGTWTWNAATKAFTVKITTDTNGTWGFSDPAKRKITLSGDVLSLTVPGEGTFKLARIVGK